MGKKVLMIFSGTRISVKSLHDFDKTRSVDYFKKNHVNLFEDNVVRIYFSGCEHTKMGGRQIGGSISPNLDVGSARLRGCFNTQGELSLVKLKKEFGDAVIIEGGSAESIEVEDITLSGFSRGAVATFAAARHLDDLNIPISLFAEDPVPGDSKSAAKDIGSEFFKNQDLRACKNLIHAEVILGLYKKNVNPIHNKYFRQMAPLFNPHCNLTISTVPKTYHNKFSVFSLNHEEIFLYGRGIFHGFTHYSLADSPKFYVPKIFQQKFHIGTVERTQLSRLYKEFLLQEIRGSHPKICAEGSVKQGQALYALYNAPQFPSKILLINRVIGDTSIAGKALREFIVEFENINQYVFRKTPADKLAPALNTFRGAVYELIASYHGSGATYQQKQDLRDKIIQCLPLLSSEIPGNRYREINELMHAFLDNNVIFHPDLTQYIDETETYATGPSSSMSKIPLVLDINEVQNVDELERALYYMSPRSAVAAYDTVAIKLPDIALSARQLGRIIRFFSPEKISDLLKHKKIFALINTIDDVNSIMSSLFTSTQREKVFCSLKDKIVNNDSTPEQWGSLLAYLPEKQKVSLLNTILVADFKHHSSKDLMILFGKLSQQELSHLLPLCVKKIEVQLSKHDGAEEIPAFLAFLKSNVTGDKALKSIDQLSRNLHLDDGLFQRYKMKYDQVARQPVDLPEDAKSILPPAR